jgi:hypothetical protein
MSAATAPKVHGVLARDLLRRACVAFACVPPQDRGPALTAVDEFLAAPGPATYLAAARILADARRKGVLRQARAAHAGYAMARGLDSVRRELGAAAAEVLAAVPKDDRAGLRLRALALLAAAHRELGERVAGGAELLRKKLARAQAAAAPRSPASRPPRRRPAKPARSSA